MRRIWRFAAVFCPLPQTSAADRSIACSALPTEPQPYVPGPPLRRSVRAGEDWPGHRPQPLLPGAPLQRHGAASSHLDGGDARGEGRGGLGGRQHRAVRHSPHHRDRPRGAAVGRARHPHPGPHDGARAPAREPCIDRAHPHGPPRKQPDEPRGADGAERAAGRRHQPDPCAHHDQGRHCRLPPLAPPRRDEREDGGLRHRVRVCGPRSLAPHALPLAAPQPPQRRVRRLDGEPRAAPARGHRGHQGGGRRHHGRRGALRGRRADGRAGHSRRARGPGGSGDAGRASRSLGRQLQRLGQRLDHRPLLRGGLPGALHPLRQAVHVEAGGRGGPIHLPGPDGEPDPQGCAGHDRRGAALHRGPLSAEEDRGRPHRGHPRVHRMQHLRVRRQPRRANALHPEPDQGRGVAQGLAPGTHPRPRRRRARARGPGRVPPGSRRRARSASADTR